MLPATPGTTQDLALFVRVRRRRADAFMLQIFADQVNITTDSIVG